MCRLEKLARDIITANHRLCMRARVEELAMQLEAVRRAHDSYFLGFARRFMFMSMSTSVMTFVVNC